MPRNVTELESENQALRDQLAEAQDTLEAIRSGGVDALVAAGPHGDQVFTLQGAETPYRLLMESMNEGAATLGSDGTVLYCNLRFAQMAGTTAEALVGHSFCECVAPDQQTAVRQFVADASPGGAKAEFRLKGAAGQGFPALLSLRRAEGESLALVATDLSAAKAHEEELRQLNRELEQRVQSRTAELRQSEQRYRLLFDRNPDGVFAVDSAGRFVVANPACERFSGYPIAELLQMNFRDLCAPDSLAAAVESFKRGLLEQRPQELETALVHKESRRVELLVTSEAQMVDGQLLLYCTAKDITARKQAEQRLRAANQELARFNEMLVGREMRMIELKQEINALCAKLGQPLPYAPADAVS